ncbi:hypothetical protein QAD02_009700 [Eretmocerus hayati]|uniref:Uncharacterized protein n=1 Tax=Eretmocerus hayati TaxID=131215 RepID=A0ACC2NCF8_9HYME|nr:hypothetical protein QAD02_009700 [Eretmocerus hayati]
MNSDVTVKQDASYSKEIIPKIYEHILKDADDNVPGEILFSFLQILDYSIVKIESIRKTMSQTLRDSPGTYRLTVDALTKAPEVIETAEMLENANDDTCLELFDSKLRSVIDESIRIVRHNLKSQYKELNLSISQTFKDLNYTKEIIKEHLDNPMKKPEVCTGDGNCESLLQFVTRVNSLFNTVVHIEKTELMGIFASTFLWLREEENSHVIREKIVKPVTECLRKLNLNELKL